MDRVLRPHAAYAAAYLDDVIIHSNTWAEHVRQVAVVLESLRQAGLTANPRKCAVGRREVRYLGYHLGGGQVRPLVDKTAAIAACPRPKAKKRGAAVFGRLLPAIYSQLRGADQPLDRPHPKGCLRSGPVDEAVPGVA